VKPRGQAAAEYVLIVALVIVLFCGVSTVLRAALSGLFGAVSGAVASPLP